MLSPSHRQEWRDGKIWPARSLVHSIYCKAYKEVGTGAQVGEGKTVDLNGGNTGLTAGQEEVAGEFMDGRGGEQLVGVALGSGWRCNMLNPSFMTR